MAQQLVATAKITPASKPGASADPMRRGGVGSVGMRDRVIDRDQLRKLD
jgi:hypothetical protein